MACGCTVLGSDTEPVREVIEDGTNGPCAILRRDRLPADAALEVSLDPVRFRLLGKEAERTIRDRYSLRILLPTLRDFYTEIAAGSASRGP